VNHYYVRGYRGAVVIGRAGKLYRAAVESALKDLGLRFKGRLDVSIVYVPATIHPQLDLDNLCKCLLDSLTHAKVWKDDGQIDRLLIERGFIQPPGCVSITVREL
jgi:crossover junction endodeoxyribonuclease RusA